MTPDLTPGEESQQLLALRDLDILDPRDIETFDRIARITCRMLNTKFAAVALTDRDRQWFRSVAAARLSDLAEDAAQLAPVSDQPALLVVPDLTQDAKFKASPLVAAGLRFYASVPLVTPSGQAIGSICIIDDKPRELSPEDHQTLADLARVAMDQIDLRSDALTRLSSRHQYIRDLEEAARTRPGAGMVAVLVEIIAPGDFSRALSVLGGACLDTVVLSTGRMIQATLGAAIPLYAIDGSSYLVLLDEAAGRGWQALVSDLAAALATPVWSSGIPVAMNAAFGVVPFQVGRVAPHDTIRNAMGAAQEAREADERVRVHSAASETARGRRFRLLTDLSPAMIALDQLSLAFQPRLDIASDRVVGAEALLRWRHPELGGVPPGEFIPLVEQTALARPVTEWVIDTALRQLAAWARSGHPLRASVNVSAYNLEEPDFAGRLAAALGRHDVDPGLLELEVTETALIGSGSRVQRQLEEVRMMGVEIAIDDFGTGYSTFSYLMRIPASTVKLDQSFMRRLPLSARDQTLVRSMIAMAHDLGFRVVAEGVETADTLKILADARCDEVQGYLICRPVAADALNAWLLEQRRRPAAYLVSSGDSSGADTVSSGSSIEGDGLVNQFAPASVM